MEQCVWLATGIKAHVTESMACAGVRQDSAEKEQKKEFSSRGTLRLENGMRG